MFALLVAQKAVKQYGGTPFERPLQAAFEKLITDLSQDAVFHVRDLGEAVHLRLRGMEVPDEERFQVASRAVQQHRPVTFAYRKPGKTAVEERALHPYSLVCTSQRWYVVGWDPRRKAMRSFALSRMRGLAIVEGTFERRPDFRVEDFLKGSFGIFRGDEDYEVVIELDRWAADMMQGRRWHASQRVDELLRGEMRITFRLDNLDEIEPWIRSWGANATVLKPKRLSERIAAVARAMLRRYEAPEQPGPSESATLISGHR